MKRLNYTDGGQTWHLVLETDQFTLGRCTCPANWFVGFAYGKEMVSCAFLSDYINDWVYPTSVTFTHYALLPSTN